MGAKLSDERLEEIFHGRLELSRAEQVMAVRDAAIALVKAIRDNARDSADRNAAIRFVRLAVFSAEEAIRLAPALPPGQ